MAKQSSGADLLLKVRGFEVALLRSGRFIAAESEEQLCVPVSDSQSPASPILSFAEFSVSQVRRLASSIWR